MTAGRCNGRSGLEYDFAVRAVDDEHRARSAGCAADERREARRDLNLACQGAARQQDGNAADRVRGSGAVDRERVAAGPEDDERPPCQLQTSAARVAINNGDLVTVVDGDGASVREGQQIPHHVQEAATLETEEV